MEKTKVDSTSLSSLGEIMASLIEEENRQEEWRLFCEALFNNPYFGKC